MDFFNQQSRARRSTLILIWLYLLSILGIIGSVYVLIVVLGNTNSHHYEGFADGRLSWWNPALFTGITGITCLLVAGGSLVKYLQLRGGGGAAVAEQLEGSRIPPDSAGADERKVLNIVEEMAIASGLPVPPVYLLPYDSINAFAAGLRSDQAVVAVTRGAIRDLSRDELQGVIAHEFSHILNGDMRLNLRLIATLNGILVLAIVGRLFIEGGARSRDRKGGAAGAMIFGLGLLVIGYVGVFFARIIQSAVSRQREFLADASAVQFTRNPLGIGGALRKILGLDEGSRIVNPHTEGASHLFFANGLSERWIALFSTHPPLPERIRRIEGRAPEFTGSQQERAADAEPIAGASGFSAGALSSAPQRVLAAVGTLSAAQVSAARSAIDVIPLAAQQAARDSYTARLLVVALLLDAKEEVRSRQQGDLARRLSETELGAFKKLAALVAPLAPQARLSLVDLSMPALKGLSTEQYRAFRTVVETLMHADGVCSVFEYTLLWVLLRRLDPTWGKAPQPTKPISEAAALSKAALLVRGLAALTQSSPEQTRTAGDAGVRELGVDPATLPVSPDTGLQTIEDALMALREVSRPIRGRALAACAACVASDGKLSDDEAQLIRAISEALRCPLPPFPQLVPA